MIRDQELEQGHHIKLKALDEAFMNRIKEGTSCSRFECEAILEAVKDIYFPATIDSIKPGQMLFFAVSAKEPPNKPLSQCAFIQVVLTLHNGREDDELRLREGVEALRRQQLLNSEFWNSGDTIPIHAPPSFSQVSVYARFDSVLIQAFL